MPMRKILPVLYVLICLPLTACGIDPFAGPVMTNVAMGGVSAVSYSVVGKSPVDYGLSQFRKRDCDFRNLKKFGSYCVDPEPAIIDPAVYCYRTIATPDCTNQIDPHNNGNQPIVGPGSLPMNAMPISTGYAGGQSIPASALPQPTRVTPPVPSSDPLALTSDDERLAPGRNAQSVPQSNDIK